MAFVPTPPPNDSDRLAEYIYEEFLRISQEFDLIAEGRFLPILSVEPKRMREGMLVIADGVSWNPGAGKGLYEFRNGVWAKC